ncbi:DUF2934 domain-containing protein [Povalibacter sp.]|uniref:DUF2934 domain-containing protein n=1 Tax=Povalibacter sp. TaxID=1962978 RepID=UPI002F3F6DDD
MHTSPPTEPAAKAPRSRAKTKTAAVATKPGRSRKKALPAAEVDVIALHPTPEEMAGMIATAAYFIAAERHFAVGRELDDWLEAERRVQALFAAS